MNSYPWTRCLRCGRRLTTLSQDGYGRECRGKAALSKTPRGLQLMRAIDAILAGGSEAARALALAEAPRVNEGRRVAPGVRRLLLRKAEELQPQGGKA